MTIYSVRFYIKIYELSSSFERLFQLLITCKNFCLISVLTFGLKTSFKSLDNCWRNQDQKLNYKAEIQRKGETLGFNYKVEIQRKQEALLYDLELELQANMPLPEC